MVIELSFHGFQLTVDAKTDGCPVYPQTIEVLKKEAVALAHALVKHGGDAGMKR